MKPSDDSTPGYQLGEAIKSAAVLPSGMTATRVYDSTYSLTPPPEHTPCNYGNVLSAWQQHAGFHFWWTHGNETLAADVFNTTNCQYLDDSYPSFTFQCSCLNGSPETVGNLGFALLKRGAIATDSASRVSWYYPGETVYTNTDSNAGMTYQYAVKLVRDHLPCGDAHFAMMVQVPNSIWMNHCVFNLYGDPSVQYPDAPVISHIPLRNTDVTTEPYLVQADVSSTAPLTQTSPMLHWSTSPEYRLCGCSDEQDYGNNVSGIHSCAALQYHALLLHRGNGRDRAEFRLPVRRARHAAIIPRSCRTLLRRSSPIRPCPTRAIDSALTPSRRP